MNALVVSSEPLPTSKLHLRDTNSGLPIPKTGKSSSPPKQSSSTTRPAFRTRPDPRRPNGTGDEPFTLQDLDEDSKDNSDDNSDDDSSSDDPHDDMQRRRKKKNYGTATRLEGEPPEFYNGNRAKTLSFLMEFKAFILMNEGVTIARDPFELLPTSSLEFKGPMSKTGSYAKRTGSTPRNATPVAYSHSA
ncbi:hypothetical protein BC827DRAFT_1313044 [Russula dissimulans]|nr:hypothetical protein BC827DRAFT_1313044 [Russula dissimulans]